MSQTQALAERLLNLAREVRPNAFAAYSHFLVGAAKSLFTLRSWWSSGLEMTAAGVIVGGATYLLGVLFKVAG